MEEPTPDIPLEPVSMETDLDVKHSLYDVTSRTATFLFSYFLYLMIMCIVLDFWDKLKQPTKEWLGSKIVKYVDKQALAEYLRGIARLDTDKPRRVLAHSQIYTVETQGLVVEVGVEETTLEDTTPTNDSFTPVSDPTVTPVSEPSEIPINEPSEIPINEPSEIPICEPSEIPVCESAIETTIFDQSKEDIQQTNFEEQEGPNSEDVIAKDGAPLKVEQGYFEDVEKIFVDKQFSDDEDKLEMEDFEHISDADDEGDEQDFADLKDPFREIEEPELLSIDDFEPTEQVEKMGAVGEEFGLESEKKGKLSAEVELLSEDRMQFNEELELISGQMSQFIDNNKPNVVTEAEAIDGTEGDLLQWDVTEVKESPSSNQDSLPKSEFSPQAMPPISPDFLIGGDETPEGVTPTPDNAVSPIFEPADELKEVIEEPSLEPLEHFLGSSPPAENSKSTEQADLLDISEKVTSSVEPNLTDILLSDKPDVGLGEGLISIDDTADNPESMETSREPHASEQIEVSEPRTEALEPIEAGKPDSEVPALSELEEMPPQEAVASLGIPEEDKQTGDLLGLDDPIPCETKESIPSGGVSELTQPGEDLTADLLMLGSDEPSNVLDTNEETLPTSEQGVDKTPLIDLEEVSRDEEGTVKPVYSLEEELEKTPMSPEVEPESNPVKSEVVEAESLLNNVDSFVQETISKAVEQYQSEEELRHS